MKKPTSRQEVGVITVVEPVWGANIEGCQIGVSAGGWADASAVGGEDGVDVSVVVEAGAEGGALGEAESVAAGEGHHVSGAEAFGGEHGDESGEAGEWGRDFGVGSAQACGSCVLSAQWDCP